MIQDKQLFELLKKAPMICAVYDKDMETVARLNGGEYKLDEETQLSLANKAFNTVLKESTINVSWDECCAIFDIIDRNRL